MTAEEMAGIPGPELVRMAERWASTLLHHRFFPDLYPVPSDDFEIIWQGERMGRVLLEVQSKDKRIIPMQLD